MSAHGPTQMIATVAPENFASQRVLVKSGFRKIDTRIEDEGSNTKVFEVRLNMSESGNS